MNPTANRNLHRLTLAAVLVATAGFVHGLDVAMTVVFSLTVMEIDAHVS
jgi:hypothetical protein